MPPLESLKGERESHPSTMGRLCLILVFTVNLSSFFLDSIEINCTLVFLYAMGTPTKVAALQGPAEVRID